MAMTCDEATAHLTALADGELAPGLAGAVRTHLEACPDCAAAWESEAGVRSATGREGLLIVRPIPRPSAANSQHLPP